MGVFLTVLKKTIFSNIVVWILFGFFYGTLKFRFRMVLYGIAFVLVSFSFVGDEVVKDIKVNLDYYKSVGPSGHVRLGMYIASYKIACDYLPFGSGMGTFGSLASVINGYSHVYYDYGVSKIGMNTPEDYLRGQFTLLDTYWPHILGRTWIFWFIFVSFCLVISFIVNYLINKA